MGYNEIFLECMKASRGASKERGKGGGGEGVSLS